MMPETAFLYALYDSLSPDTIEYIGCTGRLDERFLAHFHGRDQATGDWVSTLNKDGHCLRMLVLEYGPRQDMLKRESWWICRLSPRLNVAGHKIELLVPNEQEMLYFPMYYWKRGLKHFRTQKEAAEFFGVPTCDISRAINKRGGIFRARHPFGIVEIVCGMSRLEEILPDNQDDNEEQEVENAKTN